MGSDAATIDDVPPRRDLPRRQRRCGRALRRGRAVAAVTALALAVSVTACGGSSKTSKTVAIDQPCQQVSAVLSDGPDPGADPVGYAQAQVRQLRALHSSQKKLQQAIDGLASAYQQFSSANGAASTKPAVNASVHAVNAICPGAAQ